MGLKLNVCLWAILLPLGMWGQEAAPSAVQVPPALPAVQPTETGTAVPAVESATGAESSKRIFGVLPNYKTVEKSNGAYQPISTHAKFMIATKDSFDWPMFFVAGALAGLNQMTGQYPEWGQGMEGYAKRYGASIADQTVSNYLTEAILPSVLHHDPRYFRLGEGSAGRRILHAVSWVLISKTDQNHNTLNVSELLGSGASAAIGVLYYPEADRNASSVFTRFGTQVSFDAASSILKEYWPDIRQKLSKKHH